MPMDRLCELSLTLSRWSTNWKAVAGPNTSCTTASGSYLPVGLTFGPTNGPQDFQELVFIIFGRRLFKEWFLFLDDRAVAIGRPSSLLDPEGVTGAHDVFAGTFEIPELPQEREEWKETMKRHEPHAKSALFSCAVQQVRQPTVAALLLTQ